MTIPILFLVVFLSIGLAWILMEDKGRLTMARTIFILEFFAGLIVITKVYPDQADHALFVVNSAVFGILILYGITRVIKKRIKKTAGK